MTDKVQKIRKEVEKRYEYWKEKELNSHSIESEIRMSECQHLLLMINSLQEEPVSDNFCEMADKYYKDVLIGECQMEESMAGHCRLSYYQGLKDGAQMDKKEPVSQNLEEEIKQWVYDPCFDLNGVAVKGATDYLTVEDVADIARHFANWQKEQIMKDAIEVEVKIDAGGYPYIPAVEFYDYDNEVFLACEGDKVKIIK